MGQATISSVISVRGGITITGQSAVGPTFSGSNPRGIAQTISQSVWSGLDTGSVQGVQYYWLKNDTSGSQVKVSVNNTASVFAILANDGTNADGFGFRPAPGNPPYYMTPIAGTASVDVVVFEN